MINNIGNIEQLYTIRISCRVCGENALEDIIRFPDIPIADSLPDQAEPDPPEIKLPLTFAACLHCFHAQIREDVRPDVLFGRDYPYHTGVSAGLSAHFISSARNLVGRFHLDKSKKVIEIASNDGTMLDVFHKAGCSVLGIDPASGPCSVAAAKGLDIMNTFFDHSISQAIKKDFGMADLIIGNNVLAHVPAPGDLVAGIAALLHPDGHVVMEVPHLLTLINHIEFDTIFHQHYSYFSLDSAEVLFRKHGLYLNDVEQIPVHGGSIRLFFSWREGASDNVIAVKKAEREGGLRQISVYRDFAGKVTQIISELKGTLSGLKKEGKTIVGYGAAGKANTLINVSGIGTRELDYIADISPHKQGKFFTGAHLPILAPGQILLDMPDYVLILAWNFKDEIMHQLADYSSAGGKFIIPIPEVQIIG